jgi:predicted dienelactone hydrolase
MRLFEILLLVILVLSGLSVIVRMTAYRWLNLLLVCSLILDLILHLIIEKSRWQMVPVYGLVVVVAIFIAIRFIRPSVSQSSWPGWVCLALTLLFSLAPILFPVPKLPAPTGPYSIGTLSFYWVDSQRIDPYSGSPRRLMAQVWYPAGQTAHYPSSAYMDRLDVGGPVITKLFGLPSYTLSHINLAHTNSYVGAPILENNERFPVLIFSHGWTGMRGQNTFQVEELASRGYIIFAVDHTYGAAITVFPDGTIVLNKPDALPENVSDDAYDRAARILGQTWVGDLRFLMDQAERINTGEITSPLKGMLDLSRMGVFGHSTGGGATAEVCYLDPRCKAGLTMDAWMIPFDRQIPEQGLNQPFLFMQSEKWISRRNPPLVAALYDHMKSPAYRLIISGTKHYDFTDLPELTPLAPLIGLKGPISSSRDMTIIRAYSVAFFDQVFKGQVSPLLYTGSNQFPEVNFESRN